MKHYRNVKIAYDPTVNQKEEDEFDEYDQLRGGLLPAPADIPLVEPDDTDEIEVDDDIELEDEFASDEELDLDDDSLELADDDDDF